MGLYAPGEARKRIPRQQNIDPESLGKEGGGEEQVEEDASESDASGEGVNPQPVQSAK